MNKILLINQAKGIILKYTKPLRIYIYGSLATGDDTESSDIDIGYDDENFKEYYLIEDEIEKLHTLVKIDVKNIAFYDERFKNRVKATGKVIYSATKELRAIDGLYNFSKALEKLSIAINIEKEIKEDGFGDIYLDLIVKRFEFTYDMSWKALKRYLDFLDLSVKSPRATFREAYVQGMILDENIWLDMIEHRNLLSHIYDEIEIAGILKKIEDYKDAFVALEKKLKVGLNIV